MCFWMPNFIYVGFRVIFGAIRTLRWDSRVKKTSTTENSLKQTFWAPRRSDDHVGMQWLSGSWPRRWKWTAGQWFWLSHNFLLRFSIFTNKYVFVSQEKFLSNSWKISSRITTSESQIMQKKASYFCISSNSS